MAASMHQELESARAPDSEDNETQSCYLDLIPNEILLKVLGFLPTIDLLSICEVNRRLSEICVESSLLNLRNIDLHTCYAVTPHTLSVLRRNIKVRKLQTLNIANCYWLTCSELDRLNPDMPNLERLDVRGTAISLKMLMKILSSTKTLSSLSFEHRWTMRFSDFSKEALVTWCQLSEINVVVKTCLDLFIFQPCEGLQALSVGAMQRVTPTCRCTGIGAKNLLDLGGKFRQTSNYSVGREVPVYHPNMHPYLDICLQDHTCSLSFFLYDSTSPQVLVKQTYGIISSDCLEPHVSLQSVRHMYICNHWNDFMYLKSSLEFVTGFSRLKTLNLSNFPQINRQYLSFFDSDIQSTYLKFLDALAEKNIPLEHLNLNFHGGIHLHEVGTTNLYAPALGKLTGLKSLSLPICSLSDCSQSQPAWMTSSELPTNHEAGLNYCSTSFSKRQRVGPKTNAYIRCDGCLAEVKCQSERREPKKDQLGGDCVYCGSNLAQIVNGTPAMESLELLGQGWWSLLMGDLTSQAKEVPQYAPCRPSTVPAVSENALLCISRWTNLRSLALAGLPTVLRGHCLVPITQNCKQLRYLSLAHLGRRGQCQFLPGLCEAMQHAHCLEDLRLEHNNIDSMSSLFRAIQHCKTIRRLCVISRNGSVNCDDVLQMFSHCPKLVIFCLICSMTAKDCKNLKQEITRRFAKSRPALRLAIGKYPDSANLDSPKECLKNMPDVHIKEIIVFSSKVAARLPSWEEQKASRTESTVKATERASRLSTSEAAILE